MNIKDTADDELTRSRITQILKNSRPLRPNLTPKETKALKELKSDNSIKIFKADKGNSTVIMDSVDYDTTIMTLLKDETTYKIVPFRPNPIVAIEKRVNKLLWR